MRQRQPRLYVIDDAGDVADIDLVPPRSIASRGEKLDWLLEEVRRVFGRYKVLKVAIQSAGAGKFAASEERIEVEAVVQVAAYRDGVKCKKLARDSVRAALGAKKEAGAYELLLKDVDVAARSNKGRREQYLLAKAADAKL